jgi:zinc protease
MIRGALMLAAAATALAQTPPPKAPAVARKSAAAAALPNYNELKFPELRPIATPTIQSFTLPNGMQLLLLEDHELPLVNGTVLVRTGSAFDPPEKAGLAAFALQAMLQGGTAAKPGEELVRQFQDFGAELTGEVSPNLLSMSFSGLKDNGELVIDALKDGLTAPEFPQDRIDRLKAHLHNVIAHRNDAGPAILQREFVSMVFGKHSPYGAQVEHVNLDRINRGDLVSFHQRYFFPKNVTLALAGDFDAALMKQRLEVLFGEWKSEQPPIGAFPDVGRSMAPGKFLAENKDAARAFFAVGGAGTGQLDKDNPALEIMAGILAGGLDGRLNRLLRGNVDGLTASWTPGLGYPGLFEVSGTIANPFFTPKVLQTVYDELRKIRTEEVSDHELKTAKATALNRLVFGFDNQLSIMPRLAEYQYFNIPGDYTRQYQEALEAVTRADVLRVARERMDPDKLTTVVVANPTAFEAPLESLGGAPVNTIDLTIPAPKVEASVGDAASQRRARQLLARAQQAEGGADKLAAVTDYVQEIAYQFDISAGGAQANMTERWMAPNYVRQDTTSASGKISVYCDGKIGWIVSGGASGALLGVQLQQVQSNLFRTMFPLLVSDRAERKLTAIDDQTVEISDAGGNIVKIVFDNATGLPKNELYDAPVANGTVSVIETYADYREVNGLKIPFKVSIDLAGRKFQDLTIKSMQINAGLKVADLEKRP